MITAIAEEDKQSHLWHPSLFTSSLFSNPIYAPLNCDYFHCARRQALSLNHLFILFRYRRSLKLSSNFTFQVSLVWFLILTHYDSYRDKQVIKWERLPASTVKVVTCLLAFVRWRWCRIGVYYIAFHWNVSIDFYSTSTLPFARKLALVYQTYWLYQPVPDQGISVPDQGIHTKAMSIIASKIARWWIHEHAENLRCFQFMDDMIHTMLWNKSSND